MKKESLEKAVDVIVNVLKDESDINLIDRTELMKNIVYLLANYDEDIKILQQEHAKKKYLHL